MTWNILVPSRFQRPEERQIEWRCSQSTALRFWDLLRELLDLDAEPDQHEVEGRRLALQEDIRGLPGFPLRYNADSDVIVPTVTSTSR